jgi:hypothetical protein
MLQPSQDIRRVLSDLFFSQLLAMAVESAPHFWVADNQ